MRPHPPPDASAAPEPVEAASFPNAAPKTAVKALGRKPLVIGAIAAVAVLAAIVIGIFAFGKPASIPEDVVRDCIAESPLVANGVVPDAYVNDSVYELAEFAIESQEQVKTLEGELPQGASLWHIVYSGVIRNANFETAFTGEVEFMRQDDVCTPLYDPKTTSSSSKPLKGVDFIDHAQVISGVEPAYSGFASTFDQDGDAYASTATEDVTYDLWFATDTAKNTQTFVFNSENGWQPQGEITASDLNTEWTLAGRTFTMSESGTFLDVATKTSTLTFTESDAEGTLTATYVYDAKAPAKSSYHDLAFEGTLTGTPIHDFGSPSFSVELNDAESEVTFDCQSTSSSMKAGSGSVNTFLVDIVTNATYAENGKNTYRSSGLPYTEEV